MSGLRAHAVLAMCLAPLLGLGCGGAATSGPAANGPATTPEPTREELVRRGCAATWGEALMRVGPLSRRDIPQTRGYSLAQNDPPSPPEPALPDACHYPEGVCRAVRYDSHCSVHVDYRCGTAEADFDTTGLEMPCDGPELP